MDDLDRRFRKPKRKWVRDGGVRRHRLSIVLPPRRSYAVRKRAARLTRQLGREVSISMVINDHFDQNPDPALEALEREYEQLNTENNNGYSTGGKQPRPGGSEITL